MDQLTSFKSIGDKVKERQQIINEYDCAAKGFENGCSLLEAEIKVLFLQINHLDQDILRAEKQIQIMQPWTEIGKDMLETMQRCMPLISEHHTCVATELENVKQTEKCLLEEHSKIYEEEKQRLKQAHPLYHQKLVELKRLKIKTLDLAQELKIKKSIVAQQQEIKKKIFYTKIIRFAEFCTLSDELHKCSEELKQKKVEENSLLKQIVEREEARHARERQQQMDLIQHKFAMPQLKFQTNDPSSEVADKGLETHPNPLTNDKFGLKKLFECKMFQKQFNQSGTKVHIIEKDQPHTAENPANVNILTNHVVVPPNPVLLTPQRRATKNRLEEFQKFMKRRQSKSLLVSRNNSANILSQQSTRSNNSQLPRTQESTGLGDASQKKQSFIPFANDIAPDFGKQVLSQQTENQEINIAASSNKDYTANQQINPLVEKVKKLTQVSEIPDNTMAMDVVNAGNTIGATNMELNTQCDATAEVLNKQDRLMEMETESLMVHNSQGGFKILPKQLPEGKPAQKLFQFQSGFGSTSAFFQPMQPNNGAQASSMPFQMKNQNMFDMTFGGEMNTTQFSLDDSIEGYVTSPPCELDEPIMATETAAAPHPGGFMFSFGPKPNY